jgi:hypothetical protein
VPRCAFASSSFGVPLATAAITLFLKHEVTSEEPPRRSPQRPGRRSSAELWMVMFSAGGITICPPCAAIQLGALFCVFFSGHELATIVKLALASTLRWLGANAVHGRATSWNFGRQRRRPSRLHGAD